MKKLGLILAAVAMGPACMLVALDAAVAADSAATVAPVAGKMLYSAGGKKLAVIYKVDSSGSPQILLEGRLFTVPASTLTQVQGRIETSLTKKDLFTRS